MKTCRNCRRHSDDGATTCDCGYNFATDSVVQVKRTRVGAWRALHLWGGAMLFFASFVVIPAVLEHYGGIERWVRHVWWMMAVSAIAGYMLSELVRGVTESLKIAQERLTLVLVGLGVSYSMVAFVLAAFSIFLLRPIGQ